MLTFFIIILVAYILYGANLEYGAGKKFRLMTIFNWPWLIYTKGATTA